jgi:uncharacterized YigZ family protein
MDEYLTPAAPVRAELREKGSRFLGVVMPAASERAASAALEALAAQTPDATHHCWAWRLGSTPAAERSSDDGEPSGTAGVPILQVLRGAELSDVLAVVVRWYGGTKLGKGGLARAYAGAAREAVAELRTVRRFPTVDLALELPYDRLGGVQRLVHPPEVEMVDESYGAQVALTLRVRRSRRGEIVSALADLGVEVR